MSALFVHLIIVILCTTCLGNAELVYKEEPPCGPGSDELYCGGKLERPVRSPGRACSARQFRCNSGQCVDDFRMCDGVPNCADNSDETASACLRVRCPAATFRCQYGACVIRSAKCDGVRQCFDGSDEKNC